MHAAAWIALSLPAVALLIVSQYIDPYVMDHQTLDPTYNHDEKNSRVPFVVAFAISVVLVLPVRLQATNQSMPLHHMLAYTYIWVLCMLYTNAVVEMTKVCTGRIRPDGSEARSFPSGHTATAFVAVFYAMFVIKNKVHQAITAALAFAAAWCIAMTRIVDNRHFEHDVLGGIVVSGFMCYIMCSLISLITPIPEV